MVPNPVEGSVFGLPASAGTTAAKAATTKAAETTKAAATTAKRSWAAAKIVKKTGMTSATTHHAKGQPEW